jgi:hypothetical protein
MDVQLFADPWEHVRLLSDGARNAALIQLLRRHAPGNRVLEVGCGTGLLSCIAARLGAVRVYAVEPTARVEDARRLVRDNELHAIVEVIEGMVQDVDPSPVDLAFSELLNAEPLHEGVIDAMAGASKWVVPRGRLAPRRLRIWTALTRTRDSAVEMASARREIRGIADTWGLDLRALDATLGRAGVTKTVTASLAAAGPPALIADIPLGGGVRPVDVELALTTDEPGPVGGALVWFEAELDDELTMANPPGAGGHWGQLVCAWPAEVGVPRGKAVAVRARFTGDAVVVEPA